MRLGCESFGRRELVRPIGTLIDQSRTRRNKVAAVCGFVEVAAPIDLPSSRELLLVLKDQGERRVGMAGVQVPDWRRRYIEGLLKISQVNFALIAQGDVSGKERTNAVCKLGPDPIAQKAGAVIFHAAVAQDAFGAALVMERVVIGAPPQFAACDLTGIDGVDEVPIVSVMRASVVEDRGAPADRLNDVVAGESGRNTPVPSDQGREKMITPFGIHVDRLSVIVLRSVALRKGQRTFARIVEH